MIRHIIFASLLVSSSLSAQTAIKYGTTLVSGAVSTKAAVTTYVLSGNRGDVVFLRLAWVSGKPFPCIELLSPSGSILKSACGNSTNRILVHRLPVTLVSTGPHKIRVRGNSVGAMSYSIALHRVYPTPPPTSRQINFGKTLVVNAAPSGRVQAFWFAARDKAKLTLTAKWKTGVAFPCVELWGPDGKYIKNACAKFTTNTIAYTTTMAGLYVVIASGNDQAGCTFDLDLSCNTGASCVSRAKVLSYGAGCKGTSGVPKLVATTLPIVGSTFRLLMTNIPTRRFTVAALFIGANPSNVSLTPSGMPGCFMLTIPILEAEVLARQGTATWAFEIPLNSSFVGVKAYFQGWVTDRPANSAQVTTSNGLEITIG